MAKRDRLLIFAEAVILSFLLGMASISCLITGFRIPLVQLGTLAWICVGTAFVASLCFSWKYTRILPLLLLVAAMVYLWRNDVILPGLESFVYKLSRVYNAAYGWRILRWSYRTADVMELTMPAFLYILGCLITLVTAWVVSRGHSSVLALMPACLPILLCFVVTDTLPQLVWLLLFFATVTLLMLTSTTRQEDVRHGAYLTAILLIPVFAAVTVLFYCIPQVGYHRQPQAQALSDRLFRETVLQTAWEDVTGQSAVVGSSVDGSRVDLARVGYRQVSRSEILRLSAGYSDTIYLRGRALDGYSGTEWYDTQQETKLYWPKDEALEPAGEVVITTRYAHRMMYLPYYATSIDLDSVARGVENNKKLAMYSFSCSVMPEQVQYAQLQSDAAYEEDIAAMTQLPEETAAWAVPLVQEITEGLETPYQKAMAIMEYVRQSATYSLETKRMPGNYTDFAKWFLETSETGYCVHFATAATVLLKAAGIPARYVTGYLAEVEQGQTTVVLAENAHAWTEFWLPGFGWAMLEVTPPAVPEEPTEAETVTTPVETPTTPEVDPETTLPVATTPKTETPEAPQTPAQWLSTLLWVALGLMAVGLILLQWKLRLLLRHRRMYRADANRQALARWQEAVRLDRYLGKEPDAGLFSLAEKARFSQHTLTQEELEQFDLYLDSARQQLRSRNIFRRCYYTLILALY